MGKLRSNRVKRTPQTGITSSRYQFLNLEQAEPNLGDPKIGPSSVGANPIKSGAPYQLISVEGHEGERYWTPAVGIGTTFGIISVYANGTLAGNDNRFSRIHGLDFVGTGVTVETPPVEFGNGVGIATVRFTVIDQKNVDTIGQIVYNSPSGLLSGVEDLNYYNGNIGIGTSQPSVKLDVIGDANFTGSIKSSSFTGTATTAINVVGGIASVTSLRVSGVSTVGFITGTSAFYTGVVTATTFRGNLLGNATSATNVSGGSANVTSLSVSGDSSFVNVVGANANFSGIVTASVFVVLGNTSLDNLIANNFRVTGISTLGVTAATNLNTQTLNVSGVSTFNGSSIFNSGIDVRGSIVGPSTITIDPAGIGDDTGKVVIKGDLEVLGTQTTINSTSLTVEDKNIELAVVDSPTDITANGGGIILKGTTDHTILFQDATNSWEFTENLIPSVSDNKSLGLPSFKWNDLYVNNINSTNINAGSANFTGIVTATTFIGNIVGDITANASTATTAFNVSGGFASVSSLNVSGISTVNILSGTSANFSGIVTAGTFSGTFLGNSSSSVYAESAGIATYASRAGVSTNVIGGIASVTSLNVSGVSSVSNLTGANANFTGVVTATTFVGNFTGNVTANVSSATTATNVIGGIASVTSLNVSGASSINNLTGTSANFSGIVTANSFSGTSTRALYANVAGVSTNVSGGIASVTSLNVSGVSTLGYLNGASANFTGVVTATTFVGNFIGNIADNVATATTATNVIGGVANVASLNVSGISTLGIVRISAGIVTAVSGIITYYGDGSKLTGIITSTTSSAAQVSALNTSSSVPVYPTFASQVGISTLTIAAPGLVYIPSTGNLGIGTTNPGERLQINGNLRVGISSTSNYIAFRGTFNDGADAFGGDQPGYAAYTHTYIGERIYQSGTEKSELLLFKGNDGILGAGSTIGPDRIRLVSGEIRLETFSTVVPSGPTFSFESAGISSLPITRVAITTTGYVGVGTTNPSQNLHVVGDALFTGEVIANEFTSSSDSILKDVKGIVNSPLDKILQLSGYEFTWKSTKEDSIGVIAQEVEEIFPELVDEFNGFKSVNYNGLVAVLIEALKEQQSQISELRALLKS